MVRSNNKGFTLVEIMIVVAIIGILIAIAVPGFLKTRETSRTNACLENMQKIDGAVQQYILDNNIADQAAAVAEIGAANIDELVGDDNYIRIAPVCPSGGTYTLQATGYAVECSIHGQPGADEDGDDDE